MKGVRTGGGGKSWLQASEVLLERAGGALAGVDFQATPAAPSIIYTCRR